MGVLELVLLGSLAITSWGFYNQDNVPDPTKELIEAHAKEDLNQLSGEDYAETEKGRGSKKGANYQARAKGRK